MAKYIQEFNGTIKAKSADVESVNAIGTITAGGAITAPSFNGKATSAGTADNATNATNATNAVSAGKATNDGNGANIVNTYAKQNGTYPSMTVGKATNATNATNAANATNIKDKSGAYSPLATALLNMVYPVGSIYMSVNNISPQTFLGGTWEVWGAGRVPVSVASGDTDFGTVEKTGGEKKHSLTVGEMPTHDHNIAVEPDESGYGGGISITTESGRYVRYLPTTNSTDNKIGLEAVLGAPTSVVALTVTGGNNSHNNLQPYITCYMWKRTA